MITYLIFGFALLSACLHDGHCAEVLSAFKMQLLQTEWQIYTLVYRVC